MVECGNGGMGCGFTVCVSALQKTAAVHSGERQNGYYSGARTVSTGQAALAVTSEAVVQRRPANVPLAGW